METLGFSDHRDSHSSLIIDKQLESIEEGWKDTKTITFGCHEAFLNCELVNVNNSDMY